MNGRNDDDIIDSGRKMMASTLLSNRAMCHLKLYEMQHERNTNESNGNSDHGNDRHTFLKDCIDDCTLALECLDGLSSIGDGKKDSIGDDKQRLRGKILYRRARALVETSQRHRRKTPSDNDIDNENENSVSNHCEEDAQEKNLNAAAKDLLQLLSFDANNHEAAALLRAARAHHANLGGGMGRSRISRALDSLRSSFVSRGCARGSIGRGSAETEIDEKEGGAEGMLKCLRLLQASLLDDSLSSAEEIGRRGGVPLLLQIARRGVMGKPQTEHLTSRSGPSQSPSQPQSPGEPQPQQVEQCRIAALHVLSACCSHDDFVLKYAMRESLPPSTLAQIVEEEAAPSSNVSGERGSADVTVVAMALLVRLIIHWDHREVAKFFAPKIREDGTIEERNASSSSTDHAPEVDASSVCRAATAAFLWERGRRSGGIAPDDDAERDARAPRAALDLLSAWTASDLDALDAASDACSASSPSADSSKRSSSAKRATHHRLTQEDIRRLKPRQVAAHRQREAEYRRNNLRRAIRHISMFCSEETGGLDAMLTCAARASDHRLRREVGSSDGASEAVPSRIIDVAGFRCWSRSVGCGLDGSAISEC